MIYDPAKFNTNKELRDFLIENKKSIIAQKRAQIKHSDGISALYYDTKNGTVKANEAFDPEGDEIKVKAVINTTNFMDSHDDVHLDGIWDKTLSQNKNLMHLQEHQMKFDKIIADGNDLNAFVKNIPWDELGFQYSGNTQALIFDSTLKRERNNFMFNQYAKGFVKNHSVGMQYVQIELAVNDEQYEDEYKVWKTYFDRIANKELAEYKGYFFAVREAKLIEGSAVPIGSNTATPTLNNGKSQPAKATGKSNNAGPSGDTLQITHLEKILKTLNDG
ncbi:MAG: hypothetical protein K9J21_07305 [Bacteroidales bacterium]|nr:hypothetical protein [Bacteroidales bacterium]